MAILYKYWCDKCKSLFAGTGTKTCKCHQCGKACRIKTIVQRDATPIKANAHKTVLSRAMAIDPSQLEEAMRLHPERTYRYIPSEHICALEVHGARHQAKLAREHGLVDYSGVRVSR